MMGVICSVVLVVARGSLVVGILARHAQDVNSPNHPRSAVIRGFGMSPPWDTSGLVLTLPLLFQMALLWLDTPG
jgi:hypothetical protein